MKKETLNNCFPVNIAKFLRNIYFEEYLQTTASVSDTSVSFTKAMNDFKKSPQ